MLRLHDHLNDDDLLVASLSDGEAFACFYRRYVDAVMAYFAARTTSPETAADLTQETFAAALIAAPRYRPERAPAAAWLFGIARHKLTDSYRRGAVERTARDQLGLEPIATDDEDLARVVELAALGKDPHALTALMDLPEEQRLAIKARILDEDSYPQIARRQRTSETAVRQRVSRGLRNLRHRLEKAS